jgi:asparagine synthase (glutamine-hydrolysing)
MPPIFGIIHTGQGLPDKVILQQIVQAATYKVPRRIFTESIEKGWFGAVLGDFSGKTHVFCKKGTLSVIADASLYNRAGLIQKLEKDFENEPDDAALILESYIKWGTACVNYLYGDFAFVITDSDSGEIFCGRDPMGIRPFFYTTGKGLFIFASELRLVLPTFEKKPPVTNEYLKYSLLTLVTEKEKTPFEKIKRLAPGHFFHVQNGKTSLCNYWSPDPDASIEDCSEDEYIEIFRELLFNAVRMRCTDAGKLGAELSGGLDSSAVTSIAADWAQAYGTPFTAFSNIAPEGSGIKDEKEYINKIRDFRKTDWVGVDGLDGSVIDSLKDAIRIQGCFIQQAFSIFNNGLFKAVSQKGKSVLLSGFGGDELVSARSNVSWNELISKGKFGKAAGELFYNGITLKALLKGFKVLLRYLYTRINKQRYYRTALFSPDGLEKLFKELPVKDKYAEENHIKDLLLRKYPVPWHDRLSERQTGRIMQDHISYRAESSYAAAAQYGIEYRYPLLDVNLVLACLAFPSWVKFHHGTNRYIFRQAIKGLVPEEIRNRNDKSNGTIPQTYCNLLKEKDSVLIQLNKFSGEAGLAEMIDFDKLIEWHGTLGKTDPLETKFFTPGTFCKYMMIMEYMATDCAAGITRKEAQSTRKE